MRARTTLFEPMLPPRTPGTPAYRWLYEALRGDILHGRLRPGARLPATRDLARRHGFSRGTIVAAFEQLKSEGYVDGTRGAGTYVSAVLPDDLLGIAAPASGPPARSQTKRHLSAYGQRVRAFPFQDRRVARAFRANQPALDLFPATVWAHTAARRLRRVSTGLLLSCEPMGYQPLRAAVAEYLNASRGVTCTPDQVVIVSGVQEALDLTARLFLDRGDRVCLENPGYTGAAAVFDAVGATLVPVGVDDEGMAIPHGRLRHVRLVYVTPGHQFPLGVTMSLSRRLMLLEWARQAGALIFEDDYDSEYRFSARPVPALQGLDRSGLVLFAGSFSKVLFPALRLGYLVAPPDLIPYVAAAKSVACRHAPLLEQTVLCDFMTEGHFGRHVRRMREVYAERLSVLVEAAKQRLSGLLEISSIEAGLQTVGWLRPGIDAKIAASAAAARQVEVIPLSRYQRGGASREGLQLGFAAIDTAEIRRGVEDLAAALEPLAGARRRQVSHST